MQVFDKVRDFREQEAQCVATIGKYDGMHLGHQQILARLREKASLLALPTLVILSEPQPDEFFLGPAAPPRLNSFQDKVDFLTDYGIDYVYRMNFDHALSQLPAGLFVDEILVQGLNVRALVIGDDFRFGRGRHGNFELLRQKGVQAGFEVEALAACVDKGERISSTLLRDKLQAGDCEAARGLLGRYYSLAGEVVKGRQLGRQLGFPTANIALEIARPALSGVFAVRVAWQGGPGMLPGLANLGYRPTVSNDNRASLEVFLPDFEGDLYGKHLRVAFISKIRDEERFSDIAGLQEAIVKDLEQARKIFAEWHKA